MSDRSIAYSWGSTEADRAREFPCDALLPDADDIYFRAIDVDAPVPLVFRWLCQLRIAPYSYDLLDNFGRRSPRHLVRGLDELAPGQRVLLVFTLIDFARDHHLTMSSLEDNIIVSYVVVPRSPEHCRILVKSRLRFPRRPPLSWLWRVLRIGLAWGDLLMTRKQLLTFKALSEQQIARERARRPQ